MSHLLQHNSIICSNDEAVRLLFVSIFHEFLSETFEVYGPLHDYIKCLHV